MVLPRVCADCFPNLRPTKMTIKIARGEIRLPLIAMERSQKSSRGVHVTDLAEYIEARLAEVQKGM